MPKLIKANAYPPLEEPGIDVIDTSDEDVSYQEINPLSLDKELKAKDTDSKMDRLREKNDIFSLGSVLEVVKVRVENRVEAAKDDRNTFGEQPQNMQLVYPLDSRSVMRLEKMMDEAHKQYISAKERYENLRFEIKSWDHAPEKLIQSARAARKDMRAKYEAKYNAQKKWEKGLARYFNPGK